MDDSKVRRGRCSSCAQRNGQPHASWCPYHGPRSTDTPKSDECRLSDYGEDGMLCETHGLAGAVVMCHVGKEQMQKTLNSAFNQLLDVMQQQRETAEGRSWERAADIITLVDEIGKLKAENDKLRRYPLEPICLNCGRLTPCMTEADLKPGDPGVPCTFDPTPKQLFDDNGILRGLLANAGQKIEDLEHTNGELREKLRRIVGYIESVAEKGTYMKPGGYDGDQKDEEGPAAWAAAPA